VIKEMIAMQGECFGSGLLVDIQQSQVFILSMASDTVAVTSLF